MTTKQSRNSSTTRKVVKRPEFLVEGDLVRIAKDLGPSMDHFYKDRDAIVLYTYKERYGHGSHQDVAVYIKGIGFCAWYHANQLKVLKLNTKRLQWKTVAEKLGWTVKE